MILQALTDYYNRKAADPDSVIAPPGWEDKDIPYIIILDTEGNPVNVLSTIEGSGKTKRTKKFRVPQGEKKTSGIKSNLLWDTPEYVIGAAVKKPEDQKKSKEQEKHEAFRKRIAELGDIDDPGWKAVQKFLEFSLEEKLTKLSSFESWKNALEEGANMTFQLAGNPCIVAFSPTVRAVITSQNSDDEKIIGRCLVTHAEEPIENLHPAIKGIWNGNSTGTNIVSFNLPPFWSYGKEYGANAPIGKSTVFAYTTALNTMLNKDSQNRMLVGEASVVFWSERPCSLETQFPTIFCEPPKDDPDKGTDAVRALYKSVKTGTYAEEEGKTRFYVLGLSPSSARLAIRFWIVSTVHNMANNILQHFEDTRIVHGPKEKDTLSIFRLLVNLAVEGKSDNVLPILEGDLMRAILENLPYPRTLLQAAIRRTRAEQNINYPRAAIIKACLNRQTRYLLSTKKEELTMALDLENKNIGYRLGRLFAALEKIQSEANPGLNATIRDRFYGAASGTPVTVFPNLMRLKNHHLSKMDNTGRVIYFEKLLSEITSEIADFPHHLTMEDQGRFAIGYYHQIQQFYTKKEKEQDSENVTKAAIQ